MVQIHLRTCLNYRQIQTEDFFPWCPRIFKFGSEATQLDIKISDPITKLLNSEPKVLVPQCDGTYEVSLRYVTKVPLLYIRRTAGSATIVIYSVKHFVFRGADRTEGSFGAACHSTSTKVRDDTFVALRAATR